MKIEIKNYTKKIKHKIILNNINLTIKSGKIYGFYGRNGSGKTMLFRAISTLIYPTHGDILIDGKSIIEEKYDLNNIGILIEDFEFYPYLTGFDNLMSLYTINNKRDDTYIYEILKQVGLENVSNKKFKEYSLGMKQRLRIAQAIMENQKLIILDEPTNGLDTQGVKDLYKLISKLKQENKIILLASHNKEDLKTLCDEIIFIENGKIIKQGDDLDDSKN